MSELDTILAPVEQKLGRFVTMKDLAAVSAKHIADVSDDDLRVIEAFAGPSARAAKEAERNRWTTPAPVSTPTVLVGVDSPVAEPVPATVDDPADDGLTWEAFVQKHAAAPMTLSLTAALIQPLADSWKAMNAKNVERNTKIAALEARVKQLEAKPTVKFRGVYEAGKEYLPGDAATHHGGLWICRAATTGQPNQDFAGWTLAVKSRSIV